VLGERRKMQRTIKFRGMNIHGNWHFGFLSFLKDKKIYGDVGFFISSRAGAPFTYQVRGETVGQFTGLLDKNGVEIFEGDILEIQYGDKKVIAQILFKPGCFWFLSRRINDCTWHTYKQSDRELIGNIHEHPHLMEGGDHEQTVSANPSSKGRGV
jgi:uncharacterized phage protein (TIGR01671 family)